MVFQPGERRADTQGGQGLGVSLDEAARFLEDGCNPWDELAKLLGVDLLQLTHADVWLVPNRAGKPLSRSKFAELLKNKAYIGKVVFKGVEYEGRHEPIVSRELFDKVQEVFRAHDLAGDRRRQRGHYLRGTLFCGNCGARMSSLIKKQGRFEYFFCLGSHQRRTECRELYAPAGPIERQIEELYRQIRLPQEVRDDIERDLKQEAATRERDRTRATQLASCRLAKLANERDRLLKAYYADALPLEMFKQEQERIDSEVSQAESQLALAGIKLEAARDLINKCLELIANCHRSYKRADEQDRRKWNQAIFKAVYVKGRQVVSVEYKEPFDSIRRRVLLRNLKWS